MFKNTFQSGFLSILYSIGSKPLQIWDKKVRGAAKEHVIYVAPWFNRGARSLVCREALYYQKGFKHLTFVFALYKVILQSYAV